MTRGQVFEAVRSAIAQAGAERGISLVDVCEPHGLLTDLQFDSLQLVELTACLEEQLGVEELPMQAWINAETHRNGNRFTVGSLVDLCLHTIGQMRR